jgi:hypothetical protein
LSYSWNEVKWNKNGAQGCLCTRTSAVPVNGVHLGNLLALLAGPGAGGTTCLESLLKEISVIVSMVCQAMTLLRSQQLGLGRGGFLELFSRAVQNIQEGTQLRTAAGWDGHVFLGVLKHSSTPAPLFQELKGIRTRQEGQLVICR